MNNKFLFLVLVLFISCKQDQVFKGTLVISGNMPFTEMLLKTDSMSYSLPNEYKKKWSDYQNKSVTVYGRVNVIDLETADRKIKSKKYQLEPDSIRVHDN